MILVDPPTWPLRGRLFSHLASDVSVAELHAFASAVELHPRSYDGDHYDLPGERYAEIVAAGAVPVSNRELLRAVQAAGLRFRKRRGERPLASLPDGLPYLGGPHTLEILLSSFEPPVETTIAAVTFVRDVADRLLLVENPRRGGWEAPGGWREPGETGREGAVREVAEETAVSLPPAALEFVGYERIRFAVPPVDTRLHRTSHVVAYAAHHPDVGLDGIGPEGRAVRWLPPEAVRGTCAGAAWWPLLDRHLFG